jgi:hypothetical protein
VWHVKCEIRLCRCRNAAIRKRPRLSFQPGQTLATPPPATCQKPKLVELSHSSHLFEIILVILFRQVKLCHWFHIHILFTFGELLRRFRLLLAEIHYGRAVLSLTGVWCVQTSPEFEKLSVRRHGRIKLDEESLGIVLNISIVWIGLDATSIAHDASIHTSHSLELGLRPPKSAARHDAQVAVGTRLQGNFGTLHCERGRRSEWRYGRYQSENEK